MNTAVEILRRERDAAAEEAKALRARIKELDAAIALLEHQAPAEKSSPKSGSNLSTLVLEAITRAGNVGIVAKDIAAQLTNDGRLTSDASVSSTLSRLKDDSKVRNDRGLWFAISEAKPLPEVADDSFGGPPFDDLDEEIPF
jgi:hypothetical protein